MWVSVWSRDALVPSSSPRELGEAGKAWVRPVVRPAPIKTEALQKFQQWYCPAKSEVINYFQLLTTDYTDGTDNRKTVRRSDHYQCNP